jgi:hypothetical protein
MVGGGREIPSSTPKVLMGKGFPSTLVEGLPPLVEETLSFHLTVEEPSTYVEGIPP